MAITLELDSILLSVLFLALIVLVVFLIVLVTRLIGTVDRANGAIDEAVDMLEETRTQVNRVVDTATTLAYQVKNPKKLAKTGLRIVSKKLRK